MSEDTISGGGQTHLWPLRLPDQPDSRTARAIGGRLIILRDIIFGEPRHYRVLLNESEEGIASNILAARPAEPGGGGTPQYI